MVMLVTKATMIMEVTTATKETLVNLVTMVTSVTTTYDILSINLLTISITSPQLVLET